MQNPLPFIERALNIGHRYSNVDQTRLAGMLYSQRQAHAVAIVRASVADHLSLNLITHRTSAKAFVPIIGLTRLSNAALRAVEIYYLYLGSDFLGSRLPK
jgi:hypothetical protein